MGERRDPNIQGRISSIPSVCQTGQAAGPGGSGSHGSVNPGCHGILSVLPETQCPAKRVQSHKRLWLPVVVLETGWFVHVGLPWTPQGSHTPCTGSGAEYRGLSPLRLRLGLPPDEHGPQDRLGPPQMSLHAMVQLPAAACLHCSPDVPALGNKVCQASRVSLAVIHQCHPNQPSPLSRALGRGLVQFCPALKHQTRAVVTGQCAVVSSVPHSHVLIQRRSITSNTLSQAMGDQLGSPHWWLLEGQWHRGMLQASAWGRKAIAQCEGMLGLPKVCQYLYWAAYQHTSGLGS